MVSVNHTESFGPSFHETAQYEAIQKAFDLESKNIPTDVLRDYLLKHVDAARYTNPNRFERFIGDIYGDVYQCEVKHVGGPGDGGVDLYAVSCDAPHLIQVKRRSKKDAVESVRIVREFIGTMIVEGAKIGHVITTAPRFSKPARNLVDEENLKRLGIEIKLHALPQLHDMLQIAGQSVNDYK